MPSPDAPSVDIYEQLREDSSQLELQTTTNLLGDLRNDVQWLWNNLTNIHNATFEDLRERETKALAEADQLVTRAHSIATKITHWTRQALEYASVERLDSLRKELGELDAKRAALQAEYDQALARAKGVVRPDPGPGPHKVAAQPKR